MGRSGSADLLDPNYLKMKHMTLEKMVLTKRVSNKQARQERVAALNQQIELQQSALHESRRESTMMYLGVPKAHLKSAVVCKSQPKVSKYLQGNLR